MVCYTFTCLAVGCKFVRYKDLLEHHQLVLNNISVLLQITDKTRHLCTSGKVLFWESLAQVVIILMIMGVGVFMYISKYFKNKEHYLIKLFIIFYFQAVRLRTLSCEWIWLFWHHHLANLCIFYCQKYCLPKLRSRRIYGFLWDGRTIIHREIKEKEKTPF